MMATKVPATLIERIGNAVVTNDGRHLAVRLRDVDGHESTVGIPIGQVVRLIEVGASALATTARDTGNDTRFPVMWWNLTREPASADFNLELTLASGGMMSFTLSQHMTSALLATLNSYERTRPTSAIGFAE